MICLDSSCIIDFLNGNENARNIVFKHINEAVTTEINAFEIFLGIYQQKDINPQEEATAESFFNQIVVLSYGKDCGRNSAKLLSNLKKDGKLIEQNDCHIASIMLFNGCKKIITKNKKHFSRIKGIEVVDY